MLRKAPSHGDGAGLCFIIKKWRLLSKNGVIICYLKAFFFDLSFSKIELSIYAWFLGYVEEQ